MIVIGGLPEFSAPAQNTIGRTGAGRFNTIYDQIKRMLFTELDEPMRMIRHQNPGKHVGIAENSTVFETASSCATSFKIDKKPPPFQSSRCHKIDMTWKRSPPLTQRTIPRSLLPYERAMPAIFDLIVIKGHLFTVICFQYFRGRGPLLHPIATIENLGEDSIGKSADFIQPLAKSNRNFFSFIKFFRQTHHHFFLLFEGR